MAKIKLNKLKQKFIKFNYKSMIVFLMSVLIIAGIVMYVYPYHEYVYEPGDISKDDIKAPHDITNEFATEKKALESMEEIEDYKIDIKDSVSTTFNLTNTFFQFIRDLREYYSSEDELEPDSTYNLTKKEFTKWLNENEIVLTESQISYIASEAEEEEIERFIYITYDILTDITSQNIHEDNVSDYIIMAQNSYRQKGIEEEVVAIGQAFVRSTVFVNRKTDYLITDEIKNKKYYENILKEKIIINKGELIVQKGQRIDEETYQILKDAKLLRKSGIVGYLSHFGIFLIILAIFIFFGIYVRQYYANKYKTLKEYIIMLVIVVMAIILSVIAQVISPYALTLLIVPMITGVLLDIRLSIIMNFFVAMLLFIIIPDASIILPYMITGGIGAFMVNKKKERLKLSISGILISLIATVLFVAVMILYDMDYVDALSKSYVIFLSGVFSTVFVIGVLPFFESVFNMLTPFVLLELSNPNQPLLKKLLMEAPGTYHHSLMVGNLAEEATGRIGGDSLLARVGAYYHDIGKTERPNLFIENQISENPHDKMNPKLSAFVITSHVTDGFKIANKYKLPKPIKDIIISHHGNSIVSYFYNKAMESEKEVNKEDYRYKAPRPQTTEAAVVMLADSVEAAVRSLEDKSKGKIEGFIRKIIKGKLEDGQLDLCDLTLKDLDEIAKGFLDVLNGYFHERVKYKDNDEI